MATAGEQMAGLSVGQQAAGALVPVGKARAVLPKPDLSSVPAVETQTQAIGLITPPPDIKAIVDKTATFVAKNGGRPSRCRVARPQSPQEGCTVGDAAGEERGKSRSAC